MKAKYPLASKDEPSEDDFTIAKLLAKGWPHARIGRHLGVERQTISNKVRWLQANRWMTWDMRLLNDIQRRLLIEHEKSFIKDHGVEYDYAKSLACKETPQCP